MANAWIIEPERLTQHKSKLPIEGYVCTFVNAWFLEHYEHLAARLEV